jgi:hypothetical protein
MSLVAVLFYAIVALTVTGAMVAAILAFAGRFMRFSLLGLLIFMTLVAYYIGIIAWLAR